MEIKVHVVQEQPVSTCFQCSVLYNFTTIYSYKSIVTNYYHYRKIKFFPDLKMEREKKKKIKQQIEKTPYLPQLSASISIKTKQI